MPEKRKWPVKIPDQDEQYRDNVPELSPDDADRTSLILTNELERQQAGGFLYAQGAKYGDDVETPAYGLVDHVRQANFIDIGRKLWSLLAFLLDGQTAAATDGQFHLDVHIDPANPAHYTIELQYPSLTVGPQGPKGDKGDAGAIGNTGGVGATGATGNTGSQGPQGATGPQGAQGPQGVAGTPASQEPPPTQFQTAGADLRCTVAFALLDEVMKLWAQADSTGSLAASALGGNGSAMMGLGALFFPEIEVPLIVGAALFNFVATLSGIYIAGQGSALSTDTAAQNLIAEYAYCALGTDGNVTQAMLTAWHDKMAADSNAHVALAASLVGSSPWQHWAYIALAAKAIANNAACAGFDCAPSGVGCNVAADFTTGTHGWQIGDPAALINVATPGRWQSGIGFESGQETGGVPKVNIAITNAAPFTPFALTGLEVTMVNTSPVNYGAGLGWRYKTGAGWQPNVPAFLAIVSGDQNAGGTSVWRANWAAGFNPTGVIAIEIFYAFNRTPVLYELHITELKLSC